MDTKELKHLYNNPYAWPGGYPKFLVTKDGGCLCHKCVKDCYREIVWAAINGHDPQWEPYGVDVNWESTLYCDHCNELIESAYPPVDSEE